MPSATSKINILSADSTGSACKNPFKNQIVYGTLQKEKLYGRGSHTKQIKCKSGSMSTSLLPLPLCSSKRNVNVKFPSENISNSVPIMDSKMASGHSSAKLRDKEVYCNKDKLKIWKRRKRDFIEKRNVTSPISKAYYNVIFQSSSFPITFIISVAALLSVIATVQAQSSFSSNTIPHGPGVTNSNIRQLNHHSPTQPEGFFYATNGSSSVVISDTLLSDASSGHFGLSFRTCTPGELLKQIGDNLDELKLVLTPKDGGSLHFTLKARNGDSTVSEFIGSNLLDARWHTVLFQVSPSNDQITINIPGAPATASLNSASLNGDSVNISTQDVSDALSVLDLSKAASPQLSVGAGFIGCIREGPKVRFTKSDVAVTSQHVKWGHAGNCLLPYTCNDYDWSELTNFRQRSGSARCPPNHCKNGGVCLPPSTTDNQDPICLCEAGFTGPVCATRMVSCAEKPCREPHNSNDQGFGCVDDTSGGTDYTCNCGENSGYGGKNCEIEVDTCSQNACNNGGECLANPGGGKFGGHLCDCLPGYGGLRCENVKPTDPCGPGKNPCNNGGTCSYNSAQQDYSCRCPRLFSGEYCEIDDCRLKNCPNNSRCTEDNGNIWCKCLPGFKHTGAEPNMRCEEVNECDELQSPCQNGGTCTDKISYFECVCPPGYGGKRCSLSVNVCGQDNPCQHNGVCRDIPESGSVECDCTPGYTGQFCQQELPKVLPTGSVNIHACLQNPCQNGGSCQEESFGNYSCTCTDGFEGRYCQHNIDDCKTNPCRNGGNCFDGLNDYTCNCTDHYMGKNCDQQYEPCIVSKCKNEGQCKKKLATSETPTVKDGEPKDFYCECKSGFTGYLCEIDIDDCIDNPCPENRRCIDKVGSRECRCPKGKTGDTCEDDINECFYKPCKHDGTCIDEINIYRCNCTDGWTGTNCEVDVDECAIDKAKKLNRCNNGICINEPGYFQCYCRPGFTGDSCDKNFDECLENPCQNGGVCKDRVNEYWCDCQPGFEGTNCETDIDECAVDPCENGATCQDRINNFTCTCRPGYTGQSCQNDINECQDDPCKNNGECIDEINNYRCNCNNTGFEGYNCTINIDECEINHDPCQNNGTCNDLINKYECSCYPGYNGTNCEIDIPECVEQPCLNQGECFEKSKLELYQNSDQLPLEIKPHFIKPFNFDEAEGFVCKCSAGFEGDSCQININECESEPCVHGECQDGIADFTCKCNPGFEGELCELEIDECDRYKPCEEHGICTDKKADYDCQCEDNWGGKNCSVPLTGCETTQCLHDGTCTAWCSGDCGYREQHFKCTCPHGFQGERCQTRTTMSLSGNSYIKIPSTRSEGYELHMRFKTTLGSGLIAVGQGNSNSFSLFLKKGQLNLHSPLIGVLDGIWIGKNLNNTEWQKIYVAVNTSHLTLGINDKLQATRSIIQVGENATTFLNTFIGGTTREHHILTNQTANFTGCVQDIVVNSMKITEEHFKAENRVKYNIEEHNTSAGCDRKEQCKPNPCGNGGVCRDLWNAYSCSCPRPFLGLLCQYSYTAATFGNENITDSIAVVDIDDPTQYLSHVDISMFIRTRQEDGFLFYLGSDPFKRAKDSKTVGETRQGGVFKSVPPITNEATNLSNITCELTEGKLVVEISGSSGQVERVQVYSVELSNGHRHFIRVIRQNNLMIVKVNETISLNQDFPSLENFITEKLYLGHYPIDYLDIDDGVGDEVFDELENNTEMLQDHSTQATIPAGESKPEISSVITSDIGSGIGPTVDPVTSLEQSTKTNIGSNLIGENNGPGPSTVSSDKITFDANTNLEETTQNEVLANIESNKNSNNEMNGIRPRLLDDSDNENRETSEERRFSTSPLQSSPVEGIKLRSTGVSPEVPSRERRDISNSSPEQNRLYFKGIIQDVQISDGDERNTRIIEFFQQDFEGKATPKMPESIGKVTLRNIKEGEISDNTCKINPCKNNGTCNITWNDYVCECDHGWKGRNCDEREYCYWNKCPGKSTCHSLSDGYECRTNATFNGVSTSVSVKPENLANSSYASGFQNTIKATFRSKYINNGTILQIVGDGDYLDKYVRVSIEDNSLLIEIPEGDKMINKSLSGMVLSGSWQTIEIIFSVAPTPGYHSVKARLNNEEFEDLTLDSTIDFANFITTSKHIIIGASIEATGPNLNNQKDIYTSEESDPSFDSVEIHTSIESHTIRGNYFRGCIGEVRIGDVLLPFYDATLLNETNFQNKRKFTTTEIKDLDDTGCTLCYKHECKHGGTCDKPDEIFECACPDGFEGPLCSIDIDECQIDPKCKHGTCKDGIAKYTCECDIGWTGSLCDEDLDECLEQPCKNSGTCEQDLQNPGNYTCFCSDEYIGANCEEVKIKNCTTRPCQNDGRCMDDPDSDSNDKYTCDCTDGYQGKTCDQKKDYCEIFLQPCEYNSTCVSKFELRNYKCICQPGYTGQNCDINIDDCASNPCMHGATCKDGINEYECVCDKGWRGDYCEHNIDECNEDNPCVNGTCYDTEGSYHCKCSAGFCGKNCDHTNPCQQDAMLCKNNGRCVPTCDNPSSYFSCNCTEEWEGELCILPRSRGIEDIALIVGPVVGGMLFIAIVGAFVFLVMARRRRRSEGKYKPATQEQTSPRLQLDNMIKPPPEERLI